MLTLRGRLSATASVRADNDPDNSRPRCWDRVRPVRPRTTRCGLSDVQLEVPRDQEAADATDMGGVCPTSEMARGLAMVVCTMRLEGTVVAVASTWLQAA